MTPLMLLAALLVSCAPDYPDDSNHQDTVDDDCIACHVESDAGSDPSDSHFDDDLLKESREECTSCHAVEE